jgi:hypothetical protein
MIGGIVTSRGNQNDDDMPGPADPPQVCYEIRDWLGILLSKQEPCDDCCPVAACVQSINWGESIKRCEIGTNGSSVLSEGVWKSVHPRSLTDSLLPPVSQRATNTCQVSLLVPASGTYQPYDRVGEADDSEMARWSRWKAAAILSWSSVQD